MDHRLLVARQDRADRVARLEQRLAEAGDVAVAEDGEHAAEQRALVAVEARVLLREKTNNRLRSGESNRGHHQPPWDATKSSTSGSVGMKLAQPWRVTTIAPVAQPMRTARSSGQPWSQP